MLSGCFGKSLLLIEPDQIKPWRSCVC